MITPLEKHPELAKKIGVAELYFKREDLHPYGSHKGRSIPVMIDRYYSMGDRRFAISSSGNAALAAALYIKKINTENQKPASLEIFVGKNIATHKMERIQALIGANICITSVERPLQSLTEAVQEGARSLRQSTDDTALIGYKSLAEELAVVRNLGALFIATSSGTTTQALAQYFSNKPGIQIHIIQTSSCHPMVDAFKAAHDSNDKRNMDERSIADAIVDKVAERKNKLIPLIKKTGGSGWLATNEEIKTAQELAKKYAKLEISTNSALSIVGVIQAVNAKHPTEGAVVCLICGE